MQKCKIEYDASFELSMRINDLCYKSSTYEHLTLDIDALTYGTYMDPRGSSRYDDSGCCKCRKVQESVFALKFMNGHFPMMPTTQR